MMGESFISHISSRFISVNISIANSITNIFWYVNNYTKAIFISWFVGSVYIMA